MLRLQSFPADWVVEGGHRESVRQVGNATPPLLAEVIARSMASQLFDVSFVGKRRKFAIAHADDVPRRRATVKEIPAKYEYLLEKENLDHPGAGRGPNPRGIYDPLERSF